MLDPKLFDELADKLSQFLPPGLKTAQQEAHKQLRVVLQNTLTRLDLVSREEFDIQQQMLLRLRQQVEQLEQRIQQLEQVSATDD